MIRRVFMTAVLTALLASLASAQGGGGGGRMGGGGGMGGGGVMGGGRMGGRQQVDKSEVLATEFKFTPAETVAVNAIMDDAQKQADPIVQQIGSRKKELLDTLADGKDASDLMKQLASLNAQMLNVEVDAFTKTLAKLDAKQKSKAPKLFELMAGMFTAQGGWHRSN